MCQEKCIFHRLNFRKAFYSVIVNTTAIIFICKSSDNIYYFEKQKIKEIEKEVYLGKKSARHILIARSTLRSQCRHI